MSGYSSAINKDIGYFSKLIKREVYMALLSPGYETKETSTQTTIVRGSTGRAAMVGKFTWGPVNVISQVTDEVELKDQFGIPNDQTAAYFMSAANFLQVGNDLRLVRVIDKELARNASPLFGSVVYELVAGGTGYKVGDVIEIFHKSVKLTETGKVTAIDADGRITNAFIPSKGISDIIKANSTYPIIGSDFTTNIITETGLSGSIKLESISQDSGIIIDSIEFAKDIIEGVEFTNKIKNLNLPLIAAVYPGEYGSQLEVEIISKAGFEEQNVTKFPSGVVTQQTARANLQYGPQDDNQYAFVVRRGGIVVERFVVSTVPNTKDIYGRNIFIDTFFGNGGSRYIYSTSTNFPKGFNGVVELNGGLSSNDTILAGDLMEGWDMFADKETIHVTLLIAGAVAAEDTATASTVQKHVAFIADQRKDCVAFISPPKDLLVGIPLSKAIDNLVEWRSGKKQAGTAVDDNMAFDTTYQFIDGNFKYQYDKYNDVSRWIPLAADIAGLCVHTDNVANVWNSIAGLRRGTIPNAIKFAIEPKQSHRDRMYVIGINPVYNDNGSYVLMGDKTGTNVPSPFDRINVRRLFNKLKYEIGETSKFNLFENNTNFTRSSFRMETTNYLNNIKSLGGVIDFRVVCDSSNNTQAVVDRNEFVAQFWIKPPKSINYISLEFIATDSGADFDEMIGPMNLG